jgi:hypothetical protein
MGEWNRLDYEATIGRLVELVGRDVLVEIRIDPEEGEPRVSTIGRLLGAPPRQGEESAHTPAGQEHLVFDLDSGGTFTLFEGQFVAGEWLEEDTRRLTITMRDSEMRVIELGGRVPSELEEDLLL